MSNNQVNPKIFCIVVESYLRNTDGKCPLPNGSCVWKHKVHSGCTYSREFVESEPTIQDIALRTGHSTPTSEEVSTIRNSLHSILKQNLLSSK